MVLEKLKKARLLSVRGLRAPPADFDDVFVGVWIPAAEVEIVGDDPLDEEQQKLAKELEEHAQSIALPKSDEYAKWEQRWLALPGTYARFLRAEDYKLEKAKKRLKETMEWRREYKPDLISPKEIREETKGGKIVVSGFCKDGMPVIYLRPANENTEPSPTQVRHMIFQLERSIDLMPEGVSKVAMIVDFKGAGAKSSPPMKITKSVVSILQHHYPERLGRALVCNLPWYLKSFFTTVSPFLDEQTRQKLKMNPDLLEVVPKAQLDSALGGEYHFKYDHAVYLPAICEFCGIADDGTRSKEHAGPTESYEEARTPALLNEGKRTLSSTSRNAQSAPSDSSRTLVEEEGTAPKVEEKEKAAKGSEAPSPPKRRRRDQKPSLWTRLCGSAGDAEDEPPRRKEGRKKSSEDHLPSLKNKTRSSAVERIALDVDVEPVQDPAEAKEVEDHFKRGEPVHYPSDANHPEILQALEMSTREEMAEKPMVPALARADTGGEGDPIQKAKKMLASEDDTGRLRSVTSDHAQTYYRPPAPDREASSAPDELTFEVKNAAD